MYDILFKAISKEEIGETVILRQAHLVKVLLKQISLTFKNYAKLVDDEKNEGHNTEF
jgi:hypothetical protein